VDTLHRKWPAKEEKIEAAIQKVLVDLGLSRLTERI